MINLQRTFRKLYFISWIRDERGLDIMKTVLQMQTDVIQIFGFEHQVTVNFFEYCATHGVRDIIHYYNAIMLNQQEILDNS
jgi:hypothetical protein